MTNIAGAIGILTIKIPSRIAGIDLAKQLPSQIDTISSKYKQQDIVKFKASLAELSMKGCLFL